MIDRYVFMVRGYCAVKVMREHRNGHESRDMNIFVGVITLRTRS
jgi:hypothetical protein